MTEMILICDLDWLTGYELPKKQQQQQNNTKNIVEFWALAFRRFLVETHLSTTNTFTAGETASQVQLVGSPRLSHSHSAVLIANLFFLNVNAIC